MKRVWVMIAAFLAACASVNVSQDYTLGQTNKEGLLVVSVSGEGLAKGETPVWHYRRDDGAGKGEIITGYLREPLDWNDPPGRLAYIALAPGRYEFYEAEFARQASPATTYWTTGRGGIATASNSSYAGFNTAQYASLDAEPFSVPFEVLPGQATYLGNLHFVWNEGERKGKVVLVNRAERDLALLQRRLPNIQLNQIRPAR
jgi:hypothetical protein